MTPVERRREQRDVFTVTVEYSYADNADGRPLNQWAKGLTTNISSKGLGFYTYIPLAAGQSLNISGRLFRATVPATVRWCSKVSDHIYKIGLRFN